ncbi:Rhs family protein [Geomicrobium sp. JCM 19037]|uniref:phage minor capsid protein n=1 Tax=Geomicrobium sp. JCM 19037 TaxID=1460634 RepID=UPI00045F2EB7|nr:phage minor capsid protein [Geomicrobium sp. JCM 19037]GAK03262.1 Rhs family protein [Geomicrobium sp. JCM 19037]
MRETIDLFVGRVASIVGVGESEVRRILREADYATMTRREQRILIAEVSAILDEVDRRTVGELETGVRRIYEQGRTEALVALGTYASTAEARDAISSASTSRLHRTFVADQIASGTEDLLVATYNTRRHVKQEVRKVARETMRSNEAITSQRADIMRRLNRSADMAIVDRAGRQWGLRTYTEMAVRTKMAETHREATVNQAEESEALYVEVLNGIDPCDRCAQYGGQILRIGQAGDSSYPTLDDAVSAGLYHPNCACTITPVSDPDWR